MTKFIECLKHYKCLYDPKSDLHSKESKRCWIELSRQMKYSVPRCQRIWRKRLEGYAEYLATNRKESLPAIEEMEFVGEHNVYQLLGRTNKLRVVDTTIPASFTLKPERLSIASDTSQDVQELSTPAPTKRARRNAIDDNNPTQTPYELTAPRQLVGSLPRLPPSNTPKAMAVNRDRLPHHTVWNTPNEQRTNPETVTDNLPANLHSFGMLVATTLFNFPAKQQILLKGKIFDLLQNAELGN